jgi:hypothetical protein
VERVGDDRLTTDLARELLAGLPDAQALLPPVSIDEAEDRADKPVNELKKIGCLWPRFVAAVGAPIAHWVSSSSLHNRTVSLRL